MILRFQFLDDQHLETARGARLLLPRMLLFMALVVPGWCLAADSPVEMRLAREYRSGILPALKQYCFECHSADRTEADIDLTDFRTMRDVRQQLRVWVKIRGMLETAQMPPKDAPQPTDTERNRLQTWVRQFLTREAEATAGDPGPVILRRLNNEEYNYTIQDLTRVGTLNPTREFPVDGAAGEGFINAGSAQSMSPALVTKYLDAAKEVATHAVLLPDGIRFSPGNSRRNWTDEHLAAVRRFYARYTIATDIFVNVGGAGKLSNRGGAIPLDRYLAATLTERQALQGGTKTIDVVAREQSLNAKYLGLLWKAMTTRPEPSLFLGDLRRKWQQAKPADAPALANQVTTAQPQLWKFNSIGQLTDGARQKTWMEPVSPLVTQQDIRIPIPATPAESDVTIYLAAHDLADGHEQDLVVWQQPRFEFKATAPATPHPPILLRDIPVLVAQIEQVIKEELPRTTRYLDALVKHQQTTLSRAEVASQEGLHPQLLERWSTLVGMGHLAQPRIEGLFTLKQTRIQGYPDINGWGLPQTPSMLTNRSRDDIRFLTLVVPGRGVTVHPSPTQEAIVAWRSPLAGKVRLKGKVTDTDSVCGNGAAWRLELRSRSGTVTVATGEFDNGGKSPFQPKATFLVQQGDVISLVVNAREKNHSCDTTHVELTISEVEGKNRKWDLASDVVDRILESNPLPDAYGNAATWHFCASANNPKPQSLLIPGSALARWHAAVKHSKPPAEIARWARNVQDITTTEDEQTLTEPDRLLRKQLRNWTGPLQWTTIKTKTPRPRPAGKQRIISPHLVFGKHPHGHAIDAANLCLQAPRLLEVRVPAALVNGATFVTSATLHETTARQGSVQVQASLQKIDTKEWSPALPILVSRNSQARDRLEASVREFQQLFPPALCYSRIVPVDEVVTLVLYFREDQHLQRLMLKPAEIRELDRLWDELLYVAQAPIALTTALEQIYEFATQDRPDLVNQFEPMREPINARADAFRKRLVATEPLHLKAVIDFAARAWRRPLATHDLARADHPGEAESLRRFYRQLRKSEIEHDMAIRLTLARVLTSPSFLYRREQPGPGKDSVPVSDNELATRLSYFLWSSQPDATLRRIADSGQLTSEPVLRDQTRRMLKDPRTRRLAIQFACQWLHVRNFDQNEDKNEALYPQFATLRADMYEETVRFFEDMFRNDGSVLDMLTADHSFLNAALASHYGIPTTQQADPRAWQRVAGLQSQGRGGILAMGTVLASQSGASRTSPILRGNWVFETLLGERLPRPPANVPDLPNEVPGGLTARQLIEKHSSVAACAKCHARIDPFGFALEQYDAIGRVRPTTVNTRTRLFNGQEIDGLDGLRTYLATTRRDDFIKQFSRKLLGFSLGRELQLSDEQLVDTIHDKLKAGNYRFSVAVETIVMSNQFRQIRGQANSVDDQ